MKYPKLHKFDKMETPREAIEYILPYLDKEKIYWECCYGRGKMSKIEVLDKGKTPREYKKKLEEKGCITCCLARS